MSAVSFDHTEVLEPGDDLAELLADGEPFPVWLAEAGRMVEFAPGRFMPRAELCRRTSLDALRQAEHQIADRDRMQALAEGRRARYRRMVAAARA